MQFIDKTLLAFFDPVTATALVTDEALRAVVSASYNVPAASLTGTATPRFDRLDLAPFAGQVATEIAAERHTIHRADTTGPEASGMNPRMDVLWSGAITVAAAFPHAEIGVERVAAPDLSGIDAAIPAPPPADPTALESARRAVVIARLQSGAQNPAAVSDATLNAWLEQAGFATVTEFLAQAAASAVPLRQFVLSFTPLPGTAAPAPVTFPIVVGALIRDLTAPDFRLADLMQASRAAQARLEIEGISPKAGAAGVPRGRPAILWVVAAAWFDDSDWPGGTSGNAAARRAARITKATGWLAAQGIALVPVPE